MNEMIILAEDTSKLSNLPPTVRVLGIDLGTTNSTVSEAYLDLGSTPPYRVECISVKQPTLAGDYFHFLLPSVVVLFDGEVFIGEGAKRLRGEASSNGLRQYETLFYECKNEIGVERTYHRAPEGFRSAAEIGGKVLAYLHKAALSQDATPVRQVVVTVPASFQLSQREDTLKATKLSGLEVERGGLLDEPIAAFLDYVARNGLQLKSESAKKNWLVFDFGGGTCDVAVFAVEFPAFSERPRISPLSVSRYHRLGGGDIDAAIVYDVLLSQLYSQNEIGEFEFGWDTKKRFLEPALRNTAEALKISLCDEISRLIAFNHYENANKEKINVRLPVVLRINVANRELVLNSAQLNAKQFEQILEPFLDEYVTLHQETEYRTTCSIFAPLSDALYRAGLESSQIDYCLAVGGSTLIPQVNQALKEYFANGKILTYDNADDTQTAVARGAAYHALSLALFGKGLLQPICFDPILVMTQNGLAELIKPNTTLPTSGCRDFTVPESSLMQSLELKIEIHAGEGNQQRMIERKTVQINDLVNQGDRISLEYRMDENQVLYMQMRIENLDDQVFEFTFENPLTNVVNPQPIRMEIDRIEEDMRVGKIAREQQPDRFVDLAKKYQQLGQRDKAMSYLRLALTAVGTPDPYILNLMGILAGEIGDKDGEIKLYRQAAKETDDGGPLFNAALALEKKGRIREAIREVDAALERDNEPPYYTLRAILAEREGDLAARKKFLEAAQEIFGPLGTMTEWELGWYLRTMRMLDNMEGIKAGEAEFKRRKRTRSNIADSPGQYLGSGNQLAIYKNSQ